MIKHIYYRKNDDCYYKINDNLKRITKINKNEVSYLDYASQKSIVMDYRPITANRWKQIENSFFLSRDFEWEYNGERYKTNNKPINWNKGESLVFNNGKIWEAYCSGNYYPRIQLRRNLYRTPTRKVLIEKKNNILNINPPITGKWTNVKYCRNFEKIS